MNSSKKISLLTLLIGLSFVLLFYKNLQGLNLFIFNIVLLGITILVHKPQKNRTFWVLISGQILSALAVGYHASTFAITLNWISLIFLQVYAQGWAFKSSFYGLRLGLINLIKSPYSAVISFSSIASDGGLKVPVLRYSKILFVPLILVAFVSCNTSEETKSLSIQEGKENIDTIKIEKVYNYISVFKDKQRVGYGKQLIIANDTVKVRNYSDKMMYYLPLDNATDIKKYKSIFILDDEHFKEIGHIKLRNVRYSEYTDFRYTIRIYNDTVREGSLFLEPMLKNYETYLGDTAGNFMEAIHYFYDRWDKADRVELISKE